MPRPNFQFILDIAQANSYPGMREDLADRLGFSPDALIRLGVGYLPFVKFKGGNSKEGWWVTPERDAAGIVVGLALRNAKGDKCMYPGSKHGLVYEFTGQRIQAANDRGAGFVRTMNIGIPCPVCNKPDGCLLAADNPHDPKAVICIRVESEKRLGESGFLHILKPEGGLRGTGVFAGLDPVYIVEGMTDVATLLSLGITAIGRPSDRGGFDLLGDILRGRICMVVGENDKKADGREPGREGMAACFRALQTTVKAVRMCMPPAHAKDVRAWVVRDKLTQADVLAYIEKHAEDDLPTDILEDSRVCTLAEAYIKTAATVNKKSIIRRWNDGWYSYWDRRWGEVDGELFNGPLYTWLRDIKVMRGSSSGPQVGQIDPTTSLVNSVLGYIKSSIKLEGRMPQWIDETGRPDPRDLVLFKNGILNAKLFIAGAPEERYWINPTSDFFSVSQIPFDFDPDAECPTWTAFLTSTLAPDWECIQLLQEWFGYCLVPDRSFERMLYLHGPTRAGKGCILTALTGMVGRSQVVTTDFATLCTQFGLEDWFGKLAAIIEDARTPRSSDAMRGLERILNITGGDSISVARKFKTAVSTNDLIARLTVASNEFLDMPDHALALPRRVNLISLRKSFRGHEDYTIKTRLQTTEELQGIVVWALKGLVRLRQNMRFTEPASSRKAMLQWQLETNPLAMFLNETCKLENKEYIVHKKTLFVCWEEWCKERGFSGQRMSETRFYGRVRSNVPHITEEADDKGDAIITGIELQNWAARKYLGINT